MSDDDENYSPPPGARVEYAVGCVSYDVRWHFLYTPLLSITRAYRRVAQFFCNAIFDGEQELIADQIGYNLLYLTQIVRRGGRPIVMWLRPCFNVARIERSECCFIGGRWRWRRCGGTQMDSHEFLNGRQSQNGAA